MMDGLNELLSQFSDMADIEDKVFKSVDECGVFVRDDARLRAPVDIGDLRKSISHTTENKNGEIEAVIHTNSDHAAYVEFGTGPVGAASHAGISPNANVSYSHDKWLGRIPALISDTDSGFRYISGQPAQPYLYPALKDNEEQLEAKLKKDIRRAIEEKTNG